MVTTQNKLMSPPQKIPVKLLTSANNRNNKLLTVYNMVCFNMSSLVSFIEINIFLIKTMKNYNLKERFSIEVGLFVNFIH